MLDYRVETFLCVCRWMSYTRAADELHISQPAVSQHIRYLEERYGLPLFVYQGRKLRLTDAGERLRAAAAAMRYDESVLRGQLDAGEQKRFVFGATRTVGDYVMPDKLMRYLDAHPRAEIRMLVDNTETLLARLDDGELDFAVIEGYFRKTKYASRVYSRERFVAVCGAGRRFEREPRQLSDLYGERLILREPGSGTREILERRLTERNCSVADFDRILEVGSICAIRALVAGGYGVTFLYEAAVRDGLDDKTLRAIELRDFSIENAFTAIWRKGSHFDAALRAQVDELLDG